MKERDGLCLSSRIVQIDGAYLCGKHSGSTPDRGSENKEPFIGALELNEGKSLFR
jgi:hypothetical protein